MTPTMMTTDDSSEILESVASDLGCRITSTRLISAAVSGDGYVSGHELELEAADGARQTQIVYLETRPTQKPRDGVLTLRNEETGDEVAVWLYPSDPALPTLPTVVYPDAAAVVMRKLGLSAAGLAITLVSYRPGKRAVVRIDSTLTTVYLKVLIPALVAELHARYAAWHEAGLAVPATLGWTEDGMVAFASLAGVPASSVVSRFVEGESDGFLDAVEALTRSYASVASAGPARPSLAARLGWYERRLTAHLPSLADEIHGISRRIDTLLRSGGTPEPVTIHGDLHLGQLFVDPERPEKITGILDIDTAGWGDPADDAGALYAHLVVTALFHIDRDEPREAEQFELLAERWRQRWRGIPDGGLNARAHAIAATHLLAHALGGFARPESMVARAAELVRKDENSLT